MMKFQQADEGDYRIYAGAIEAKVGDGYTAAVVISKMRDTPRAPAEAYRDPLIAGGHRWSTATEALAYAVSRGRVVIQKQRELLTH